MEKITKNPVIEIINHFINVPTKKELEILNNTLKELNKLNREPKIHIRKKGSSYQTSCGSKVFDYTRLVSIKYNKNKCNCIKCRKINLLEN